jgi:hypothetical protein
LDPTFAESFLEGGGDLTGDKIKEMPLDSFIGMLRCLAETKIEEFIKFIESQGYDIWFNSRAFHAGYRIPEESDKRITINNLEKLKQFIEVELCKESKGVVALHPSNLRLLSKLDIELKGKEEAEKPINYYDDSLISANYSELNDPKLS